MTSEQIGRSMMQYRIITSTDPSFICHFRGPGQNNERQTYFAADRIEATLILATFWAFEMVRLNVARRVGRRLL